MRILIFMSMLVTAACSQAPREQQADKDGVPATAPFVGLYMRDGAGQIPDRLCISKSASGTRFGLITEHDLPINCTAKGVATGIGALTLTIDGNPACTLKATASASSLTLISAQGPECSYYCGAGATLQPGQFKRYGTTEADARKATDFMGEPLCP